jgi:nucleotidyltransferase AbiEii toxin of type IV toxin-antitoxin system
MGPSELLQMVATVLDGLGVPYLVVGSTASTIYGEPRFTNDVDVVLDLRPDQVDAFCAAFPSPEFYLSQAAVESAVRKRFQFNIIHPSSGFKVDCILATNDPFDESRFRRRLRIPSGGANEISVATAEDVIIKKLEYFRLGESEKHIRDIMGILRQQGSRVDCDYIAHWAGLKGLTDIWDAVLVRLVER